MPLPATAFQLSPAGGCICPAADAWIDPLAAGAPGPDSPTPRRPCTPRSWPYWAVAAAAQGVLAPAAGPGDRAQQPWTTARAEAG